MSVTLKEIAGIAGVSANTVSRALKDKSDIGVDTRERIKKIADDLGYVPNSNARSLRLKTSDTIGLAVTELDNPVRMPLVENIRRFVMNKGFQLLVVELDSGFGEKPSLETLMERDINGLIIGTLTSGFEKSSLMPPLEILMKRGTPIISFGNMETTAFDCVFEDFQDHSFMITRCLIEKGCEKIVLFDVPSGSPRLNGYLLAMSTASLEPIVVARTSMSMTGGVEAVTKYLEHHDLPDAFMARNDVLAIGMLFGLRKLGFNVPEDVLVTGFDDIAFARFSNPTLTSIGLDPVKLANTLTDALFKRIEKKMSGPAVKLRIDAKLQVRESTGDDRPIK
jgi:LacI family transcriptional regulator, galactose operon repressor